ncbi:uncharacterized protein [Palaemon carinicauda]|uniref:uncharacterized protein n=1 Tax=Palaemon carinicauda TaxID=392227 RepID=UPI0035B68DD8
MKLKNSKLAGPDNIPVEKRLKDETIGEEQFGFMRGREIVEAIFTLRQTIEKHREKQKGLHMDFIDREKAYDREPRRELWRCKREKGVPEKYQERCTEEEKDTFWEEMDQELRIIPAKERVIIGGDLNGHLAISRERIERVHGGCGVGERNDGEESVIDGALAFDLAMINTFSEKKINRLIFYSSGGRESQIDLLLCKRDNPKEVSNCMVINGESIAAQHRKEAKKKADLSVQEQDKENSKQAKKEARRAVAKVKADTLNEVYKEMEIPEGEKKILGIAKARDAASKDLTQIRKIKDSNGKDARGMERSVIIPIYKGKGDIHEYGNYKGIKLISHTLKIWDMIIQKRLRDETTIGEEQFGFMPGRRIVEAIFALRQTIEKHREKQKGLHMVFIDMEKAYDREPCQELWRCMREKGVPEKYVRITKDMCERAEANVKSSIGLTESLPVNVRLHQWSALSPHLFYLVMDVVTQGIRDQSPWRMLFADDIILCSTRQEVLEEKLWKWIREMEDKGLKICRKMTEYLS